MTEEQRQAALEWFNSLTEWLYKRWPERKDDINFIIRTIQAPQPEVVTAREFNVAWVKYDDSIYMADFLQAEYPNGLRIVKENNNAVS